MTIERLSEMQSADVKLISDTDDDVRLSSEQKELLDRGEGRVLLFCLSGPMIFGMSKAIAREHNAMKTADALVMDLADVPSMGVTASLAIENVIRDAYEKGLQVYVVGASATVAEVRTIRSDSTNPCVDRSHGSLTPSSRTSKIYRTNYWLGIKI